MAGNQLPPLAPFLVNPGDPPVSWHPWFKTFQMTWSQGLDGNSRQFCHIPLVPKVMIRERLLMEPDPLTVDHAIQIALQVQTAMLEACTLQPSLVSSSTQVQHVSQKPFAFQGESKYPSPPAAKLPAERNGRSSGKRCTNYGSGLHNTHDKSGPARGVQCRSCGKANQHVPLHAPATILPSSIRHPRLSNVCLVYHSNRAKSPLFSI